MKKLRKMFSIIAITMLLGAVIAPVAQAATTEPVVEGNGFANYLTTLPKISPWNYYVEPTNDGIVMHFLTSYFTEGYAVIVDTDSHIEDRFAEGTTGVGHTFHSVKAELPAGNYEVIAVSYVPFYGTLMTGKVIGFSVL